MSANSVDPDKTFCSIWSGSALFALVFLFEYIKYGNLIKSNPSEIVLDLPAVSILRKSIVGRYRPVRVADGR